MFACFPPRDNGKCLSALNIFSLALNIVKKCIVALSFAVVNIIGEECREDGKDINCIATCRTMSKVLVHRTKKFRKCCSSLKAFTILGSQA